MDTIFENRYVITQERYLDWVKHPILKNPINPLWKFLLGFTSFSLLLSIWVGDLFTIALNILLIILCVYRIFFRNTVLAKRELKTLALIHNSKEWERIVNISDTISTTEGNTTSVFQWNQIKYIIDCEPYLLLALSDRLGIRLDKGAFTIGTCEEFINYAKTVRQLQVGVQKEN